MTVLAGSASLNDWIESFGSSPGLLVFALIVATFVSEDLTCISAGVLAAKGWLSFPVAMGACAVGIWVGDIALYGIGYVAGHSRKHWGWMDRLVSAERVAKGRRLFDTYGMRWVFASRFLPGMRLPSYLAAGAVGWSFRKFVIALAVGAWMWTPVLVGLAYYAGVVVLDWMESYQKWAWPLLIGVILALWLGVQWVVPLFSWRGRRLLRARWIRFWRWEFWPVWAVYGPVVLYLGWQAIRLRGATLFTCCNPAIPSSGFALESKGDILDALDPPDESRIRVAKYRRLEFRKGESGRVEELRDFLQEEGLDYPLVLKPDIGERGQGVAIVRSEAEARRWMDAYHGPAILQEYVEGVEFGLQWARWPGADRGEVGSISGKRLPHVTGDGKQTLEQLILRDRRALMTAPYFLVKFKARLEEVPAAGERIGLTDLGTHARGAVFTDERHLLTEALRETLDLAGHGYGGFHFGRYDVRVPSAGDLQAGRGLVIMELNGLTGEPAHIYQPGYPWWRGMRDLCRHWKQACEIGAAQRRQGAKPTSLRALVALARLHRRQNWFEADELLDNRADG